MKRVGHLYEKICDKETIRIAILKASKGKRKRKDVQRVLSNIPYYVDEIHEMLTTESFTPSEYRKAEVYDGIRKKLRSISKPNFYPDQIVHWCIYLVVSPVLFKGVYAFTCGSIPGRGVHYGKRYVQRWMRKDKKNTKYYLKMDVYHFYPSIDNEVLIKKLQCKIKDPKVIAIVETIITRTDGLPIGILLSQMLANFYLFDLDNYIKQNIKARYYIRYMDDLVILGCNKKKLHKARAMVEAHICNDGLRLKSNWQVCKTNQELLDFMGFRFNHNKTILRRGVMLRITRKVSRVYRKRNYSFRNACAIISYLGWIKHSDSYLLFEIWVRPKLKLQKLKQIIREESKNGYSKIRKHRIATSA